MKIDACAAIVTGGGSGLGEATVRALAAAGAKVAVFDLDEARGRAVASEVGGHAILCDVSNAESVESAVAEAGERHGPARVCINCAGIGSAMRIVGRQGPMPLDHFRREIEVNLIGTFNVLRVAAADMIPLGEVNDTGERGVVVNTASVAAFEGQIGQAPYAASKAGIVGLTLEAAREFAQFGIRVMTIAPGLIKTPMWAGTPEAVEQALTAQLMFPRRFGIPDEYASLVMHIIDNAMLNGEVIRLDGALRMAAR